MADIIVAYIDDPATQHIAKIICDQYSFSNDNKILYLFDTCHEGSGNYTLVIPTERLISISESPVECKNNFTPRMQKHFYLTNAKKQMDYIVNNICDSIQCRDCPCIPLCNELCGLNVSLIGLQRLIDDSRYSLSAEDKEKIQKMYDIIMQFSTK